MKVFGYQLPAMSSLILWAALWELIGQLDVTFFLPPLSSIFVTLVEIAPSKAFLNALAETGYAFFAGTFFAITIGISLVSIWYCRTVICCVRNAIAIRISKGATTYF